MNTTGTADDDMGTGTYDVNARNAAYDETMRSGEAMRTGAYADAARGDDTATNGDAVTGATTLAAVFADRDAAHEVVHRLHDEGFHDTWIGLTRRDDSSASTSPSDYTASRSTAPDDLVAPNDNTSAALDSAARDYGTAAVRSGGLEAAASDQTRIESDNWFMRFFGEGDESLHDALVRHGVNERDARSAGSLPTGSAIVTVDGANHPELAAQIISQSGGRLISGGFGATGLGTSGSYDAYGSSTGSTPLSAAGTTPATYEAANSINPSTPGGDVGLTDPPNPVGEIAPTGYTTGASVVDADRPLEAGATSYDDYGRYRAGTPIDAGTRLQLREERLRVDKSRVSRGEATVGTEVVTETHDIDVPFIREELFVERRPSSGAAADVSTPLGSGEVIRVPLTEEQVSVQKIPVVTEEIVVGKRQVEDTQHISETTRKEQLNVSDVDAVRSGAARNPQS